MQPRAPTPIRIVDRLAHPAGLGAHLAVMAAQVLDCALRGTGSAIRVCGRETANQVRTGADRAVGFVEQKVLARILDELTPRLIEAAMPELIDSVLPRLVDAALPWIRTTAVPAIINDLTTDGRISALLAQQSRSATAAVAAELRGAASAADERVEDAFRRRFRRSANR